MKLSRDGWLGLGILSLLILVTVAAVVQQGSQPDIPYLSTSSSPNGTLALKLWMKELGYPASEEQLSSFTLPREVKVIFIIQPLLSISDTEWKTLDLWVENGGVLILAGSNFTSSTAIEHYNFSLAFLNTQISELSFETPLLTSPAVTSKIPVPTDIVLVAERTDFVPILLADGQPVTVSFEQGKGRVILSTTPALFANIALKDNSIATFTLNLIALAPGGRVWFDDWHHGIQSERIVGPGQWLRYTPGGRALLFVVCVIFLALLLQGRAFGRPVPLLHETKRRGPLEHVTAIANLNRKAGHRAEVLGQYRQRVKRHLGRRYRLDPSLPDAEYVNTLAHFNSSIDKDALLDLLKRLSRKNVDEAELLRLASETVRWIKD
jgi:hypothetical protein